MEKNKKEINKRKVIISAVVIALLVVGLIIFIKFNNNMAKNSKIGKNSSSQEIVDYILNINYYKTEVEVEVKSNKNSNRYKIKQEYISSEKSIQEVIEPSNISGIKIIKEGNNLKIENTKLSITKVIEDYKDITQNNLDLINFIENYKKNPNSKWKEERISTTTRYN